MKKGNHLQFTRLKNLRSPLRVLICGVDYFRKRHDRSGLLMSTREGSEETNELVVRFEDRFVDECIDDYRLK
uniref:Uncharacterized protein n=1 Tax=Caenorhabditis tropicalis TaxID=1561998 RepID=A0A1I7U229_9PELO